MTYKDLEKHGDMRELESTKKDNEIAEQILYEYLKVCNNPNNPYLEGYNSVEDLLTFYFILKKTCNEKQLQELMDKYNFNYNSSIHNAIYYTLGKEWEVQGRDPLVWPGIINIQNIDDTKYILDTTSGIINVRKASKIFSKSSSSYIFYRELMGQCYKRSYQFLKENRNFKAVLSYMPNFFYGGHYHAYLEKGSDILDIASNAFYDDPESSSKILCGDIIAKLSFDEVEDEFEKIRKEIPKVKGEDKLLILTLSYDIKNKG